MCLDVHTVVAESWASCVGSRPPAAAALQERFSGPSPSRPDLPAAATAAPKQRSVAVCSVLPAAAAVGAPPRDRAGKRFLKHGEFIRYFQYEFEITWFY